MTVASATSRIEYSTTAGLLTYAYPFRIFAEGDLEVHINGSLMPLNVVYTVTGVGNPNGGNIILTYDPGNGALLTIERIVSLTQGTDYVENDKFSAESHETALDRLTMIGQMLHERDRKRPAFLKGSSTKDWQFPDPASYSANGLPLYVRLNAAHSALEAVAQAADISGVLDDVIPAVARGALPAAATQGRLRKLSDDSQGIAVDQGSWWGDAHELMQASAFGLIPNDDASAAVNKTRIDAMLARSVATGRGIQLGPGIISTTGGHALSQWAAIHGSAGGRASGFKLTESAGTLFTMLGTLGEAAVDFSHAELRGFYCLGPGAGSTARCFDVKNIVNPLWDHLEIDGFQYGFFGHRDAAGNSVNTATWRDCRVQNCYYNIWAPRQWNQCLVLGGQWHATFWNMVWYDASSPTIIGASLNFGMTEAGGGGIYMAGCDGIWIAPLYNEGDPAGEAFVYLSRNRGLDGNTTQSGIALNTGVAGFVGSIRGSSAGGTNYLVALDQIAQVALAGLNAGSGIGVSAVYCTTGTRRNIFQAIHANSGVTITYQDPADRPYNLEFDTLRGGSSSSFPWVSALEIETLRQGTGASAPSFADLGNAASALPSDLAARGVRHVAAGDVGRIEMDGLRDNDVAELAVNVAGYNGGTTRFRRFGVYDGKNALLFRVDGQTATAQFHGNTLATFFENAAAGLRFSEMSGDPAAPSANQARLFCRDNGAGKTQLCALFPTGAVQVLATEP